MPELPEVETMRRGLLPIVGGKIVRVEFPDIPYRPIQIDPGPNQLAKGCTGEVVCSVDRIAKRVLVRLSSGNSIVMQPKMAGIALLADPPSQQHTRVIFHLGSDASVPRFMYWDRRGLGTVSLWTPSQIDEYLGPTVLGPDASVVDQETFVSRFLESKKEVKVALLDQRIVCGVGNLYAAEILHAARVDPRKRCHEISKSKWKEIHKQTLRILGEAIEMEGSTLSDGTYRNAINGDGSYQSQHRVYDRANQPCLQCRGGTVHRIVQGQRSTFFCPRCQK